MLVCAEVHNAKCQMSLAAETLSVQNVLHHCMSTRTKQAMHASLTESISPKIASQRLLLSLLMTCTAL